MNNFWNERYSAHEYAFGTEPNVFFAGELRKLPRPGHILFPCEGEGRNAVYAAEQGWTVEAFDLSEMGKRKALYGHRHVVSNSHIISPMLSRKNIPPLCLMQLP